MREFLSVLPFICLAGLYLIVAFSVICHGAALPEDRV